MIKKYHVSKNLFNSTPYKEGYALAADGSEIENSDFNIYEAFVDSSELTYILSGTAPTDRNIRVHEYLDNTWVSQIFALLGSYLPIPFIKSSNTNRFLISIHKNNSDMMLNTGSTPQPYEPYSSEVWHDIPHYIHNTSTDTLTTLPAEVIADGNNATVGLVGNMSQSGVPSPSSIIMPSECGERTGQLFNASVFSITYPDRISISGTTIDVDLGNASTSDRQALYNTGVPCAINSPFTISFKGVAKTNSATNGRLRLQFDDDSIEELYVTNNDGTPKDYSEDTFNKNLKAIKYNWSSYNSGFAFKELMINSGSTALPYEPYGVKIPISSANTTTPVYLGEVQSTRQIKKVVLTGQENWGLSGTIVYRVDNTIISLSPLVCSHFANETNTGMWNGNNWKSQVDISRLSLSTKSQWTDYLAQQYAAGTPVTVWYVLATPTTGIVNEPLRKIGDYADTVSGISIPTITSKDSFDVLTTLKPSEVSLAYTGWHNKSDTKF